jgi:tetratricopeptide (TPR) repeat protein
VTEIFPLDLLLWVKPWENFPCPLAYTLTQREQTRGPPVSHAAYRGDTSYNKQELCSYHHRPPVKFLTCFVPTMTNFSDHSVDSFSFDGSIMTMSMVNHEPPSTEYPLSTLDLGQVHHAKLLLGAGRYKEALVELDRARAIQEQLVVGVSSHRRMDRGNLHTLADLYYWMAKAQWGLRDWPRALFSYRYAARISLLLGETYHKHAQEVSYIMEATQDLETMDIEDEFSKIAQSVCHEQRADDLMDAKDYQAARQEYLKAIVLEEQGWNGIGPSDDTVDLTWLWRKLALCTQVKNTAQTFGEVCNSYQQVVQLAILRGDLWYAQSKHHDAIGEYRKAALLGRSDRTSQICNATDEANGETCSSGRERTPHTSKATDILDDVSRNSTPAVGARRTNTMKREGSPDENDQPSIAKTPGLTTGADLPEDSTTMPPLPSLWEHIHRPYNHLRTTFETCVVQIRKSSSFRWEGPVFSGQNVVIYLVAVALAMVAVTTILFFLGALDASMTALDVNFTKAYRNTSPAVSPLYKQVALVPPRTLDKVRDAASATTTKMRPSTGRSHLEQYFVPVQASWNSLWETGVRVMDRYLPGSGKAWQDWSMPDLDLYSLRLGNTWSDWSKTDLNRFSLGSGWSRTEWSLPDVDWTNPFQFEFLDKTHSLFHENVCQVFQSLVGPDRTKYCSRKPTVVHMSTYRAVLHSSAKWMRDTGIQHWLVFLIVLVNLGLILRLLLCGSFHVKKKFGTTTNDSSEKNAMVEHLQECLNQRLRHCLAHLDYQHSNGKVDIAMRDYRQMAAMEFEFMEQLQEGFAKIVQSASIHEGHGGGTSNV